jgi:hypothetical protein
VRLAFWGGGFACLVAICDCTLDSLCLDRKCITFLYEELEAGMSNFASSKSYAISCKCNNRAFCWPDYYYGAGRDLEVVLCRSCGGAWGWKCTKGMC